MATLKQTIAAQPTTIRAAPVHLSINNKGDTIAYASNKSIFLRNLDEPSISRQYTGHTQQTTVAKFSPSGYYVASGDITGSVRIWSCDTDEQILKNEVKVINGRITDLSWDSDSQRIIAVGEGKERWGHAFTFDSGNTVGDISGHSSVPNAVSIKQSRPFRAATAGDDGLVVFYHGAPYKFNRSIRKHSKFVYGVKFSPDGSQLVSVGADAKIFIYDGKTGDDIGELVDVDNGHTGSIFSVSWDPTSKYIVTSSADQTVKVWDVAQSKVTNTWSLKEASPVDGQQVGNLWTEKYIISLSFSGNLTYLSRDSEEPVKVVSGHQKSITALAISKDLTEMYTGSYDTSAYHWLLHDGTARRLSGAGHTNAITQIVRGSSGMLSIGLDDSMRAIKGTTFESETVSLDREPKGVAVLADGRKLVVTSNSVNIFDGKTKVNEKVVSYEPTTCASAGSYIAVGGSDASVHIYDTSLAEITTLKSNRATVTALGMSSDGSSIAVGDSSGKIVLYTTASGEVITTRWAFHVARITSLQFSPTDTKVISTSLDTNIYCWSVATPTKKLAMKNAHQGLVSGAVWVAEDEVISAGSDGALKRWGGLIL